jgi:hypothetical protein
MFVEFNSLQDSARVWIYQSIRKLTTAEENAISQTLLAFTQQWAAHGQQMKSSFKILHHQFMILASDESFNAASGCSIDDSVRIMKGIDQQHQLNLFDRTSVAFFKENEVLVLSLNELSKKLEEGIWNQETPVFNNLVATKTDFEKQWIIPASQTWLKRYLPKMTV